MSGRAEILFFRASLRRHANFQAQRAAQALEAIFGRALPTAARQSSAGRRD
jgi:hypothetical protein